jgi:hypothetical protein
VFCILSPRTSPYQFTPNSTIMASAISQSLAMLVAFWFNCFLHGKSSSYVKINYAFSYPPVTGIYLVLFIQWAVNPRHRSSAIYFSAFCWIAFVACNIDFALNVYLMIKGFWFSLPQGGPDVFFADFRNWQTIGRESIAQSMVTMGDTLMVMPFLLSPSQY